MFAEVEQQVLDAGIRLGEVGAVLVVVAAEFAQQRVDGVGAGIGLGALHKLAHAVAHHIIVGRQRMGGESALLQRVVAGVAQVGDGVEQRSVQIKYY